MYIGIAKVIFLILLIYKEKKKCVSHTTCNASEVLVINFIIKFVSAGPFGNMENNLENNLEN